MRDSFYITLVSDSSLSYFPKNIASNFQVHLGRQVNLDGPWEVALSEIHYPMSFYNVTDGNTFIEISDNGGRKMTYKIPEGYHKNTFEIISNINGMFPSVFQINETDTECLLFKFSNESLETDINISMSETLSRQLGLRTNTIAANNGSFKVIDNINLNYGLPQRMYIHCNVIAKQLVGDGVESILRIVPVNIDKYSYGCEDTQVFLSPHYLPVEKKKFDVIEVNIKGPDAKLLSFQFGTSTLVLHFRKVSAE